VDPDGIVDFLRPHLPILIADLRQAFQVFDERVPPEYRLIIEGARPKAMQLGLLNTWRQRYGTGATEAIRVARDEHRMEYLFLVGDEFCVGLRNKKMDGGGRSFQHVSRRQTELRSQGTFPEWKLQVAHVFLGFRYTNGDNELQPRLTDISLSQEHVTTSGQYDVTWRRIVWDENEGMEPVRPIQQPLLPPPAPVIRPRPAAEGGRDAGTGTGS
jgi:hypothetical protein